MKRVGGNNGFKTQVVCSEVLLTGLTFKKFGSVINLINYLPTFHMGEIGKSFLYHYYYKA